MKKKKENRLHGLSFPFPEGFPQVSFPKGSPKDSPGNRFPKGIDPGLDPIRLDKRQNHEEEPIDRSGTLREEPAGNEPRGTLRGRERK